MSSITNADKSWPVPGLEAIYLHRQQAGVIPALQFFQTVAKMRNQPSEFLSKTFNSPHLDLFNRAFGNYKSALPVLIAVDQYHHAPTVDPPERPLPIALQSRNTHPEHIHRSALVDNL